jgi:hypothetical protein
LGARPVSSSRELCIIGLMRALVLSSASILVSLPLCFKREPFIIYVFLCNSRTNVITLYLGHICDVLCVNVSVLTTRMDSG